MCPPFPNMHLSLGPKGSENFRGVTPGKRISTQIGIALGVLRVVFCVQGWFVNAWLQVGFAILF